MTDFTFVQIRKSDLQKLRDLYGVLPADWRRIAHLLGTLEVVAVAELPRPIDGASVPVVTVKASK